jgi:hypothetical protein
MFYKVCTKNSTEVFDSETLLKNHKHNKKLCKFIKNGVQEIIYTITDIHGKDFIIIFYRIN